MAAIGQRGALVVLCAASFLAVVDTTIVTIALPTIRRALGFSAGGAQWVLNAYALIFAGTLLLFGRLADRVGRRRAFTSGLIVFGVGSALAGAATEPWILIVGRFVQGLGAAAFVPSSLSLLTTTFPGEHQRSRALGVYGAMAGLGFVVGMVGGGVITQLWSWRGIFWINVPILAIMLAATPRALTESRNKTNGRLDLGGAITVTTGLVAVVYALTSAPRYGWASPVVWAVGLLGIAALIGFAVLEAHHPAPLTPPDVVTRNAVLVPNGAVVLQSMVGIAWLYLLTLYFQDVHDADALGSGLLFAPMTVASIAGAAVAGRAVSRFGVRTVSLTGMALVAAGIIEMAATVPVEAGVPLTIAGMVIGELGFMLASVSLTVAVTASVAHEHAGLASGLYGTATQIGGGMGLAIVATIIAAATGGTDVDSHAIQLGFLACLAFTLLAALLVAGRLNREQHPITTRRRPVDPPVYGAQSPLRDTGGSTDQ